MYCVEVSKKGKEEKGKGRKKKRVERKVEHEFKEETSSK